MNDLQQLKELLGEYCERIELNNGVMTIHHINGETVTASVNEPVVASGEKQLSEVASERFQALLNR